MLDRDLYCRSHLRSPWIGQRHGLEIDLELARVPAVRSQLDMASEGLQPPSQLPLTTSSPPSVTQGISHPGHLQIPDSNLLHFDDSLPAENPTRWRLPDTTWSTRFKLDAEILIYQSRPVPVECLSNPLETDIPSLPHPTFDKSFWTEQNQRCEGSCKQAWSCVLSDLLKHAVRFEPVKFPFAGMEKRGKCQFLRTYKSLAAEYSKGKHAEVGGDVSPYTSETSDIESYPGSEISNGGRQSWTFEEYDRLATRPFAADYCIFGQVTNRQMVQGDSSGKRPFGDGGDQGTRIKKRIRGRNEDKGKGRAIDINSNTPFIDDQPRATTRTNTAAATCSTSDDTLRPFSTDRYLLAGLIKGSDLFDRPRCLIIYLVQAIKYAIAVRDMFGVRYTLFSVGLNFRRIVCTTRAAQAEADVPGDLYIDIGPSGRGEKDTVDVVDMTLEEAVWYGNVRPAKAGGSRDADVPPKSPGIRDRNEDNLPTDPNATATMLNHAVFPASLSSFSAAALDRPESAADLFYRLVSEDHPDFADDTPRRALLDFLTQMGQTHLDSIRGQDIPDGLGGLTGRWARVRGVTMFDVAQLAARVGERFKETPAAQKSSSRDQGCDGCQDHDGPQRDVENDVMPAEHMQETNARTLSEIDSDSNGKLMYEMLQQKTDVREERDRRVEVAKGFDWGMIENEWVANV